MNVNCQWIEKNLEGLLCDRLTEEETRMARAHIDTCLLCRQETQALSAIDPLIKKYFQHQLEIAHRSPVVRKGRLVAFSGAAAAVVAVLLLLLFRNPQPIPIVAPMAVPSSAASAPNSIAPAPIKDTEPGEVQRAKPSPEPSASADLLRAVPAIGPNAPEFLVTDPAGYSHTVDEYRGHVVVIAVWNSKQSQSIANIERLYKTYAAYPKFRFLGVSTDRKPKPSNTTFPVVYNEGSKLFGAQPGEFVLLSENGSVEMRGSLVKDFESLQKTMRGK
jgi:hypothetical protein